MEMKQASIENEVEEFSSELIGEKCTKKEKFLGSSTLITTEG